MKTLLLLPVLLFGLIANSQTQEEEPFAYEIEGLVFAYEYDISNQTKTKKQKIPKEGLKFKIVRNDTDKTDQSVFYIIKFLIITDDKISVANKSVDLNGNTTFINSADNSKYFWIRKDQLDKMIEDKFIGKSYETPNVNLSYGASLSLPFKYRPKINERNIKITPDITLGGYIGFKWRISSKKPFYITAPIATLGLTTLSINDNNTTTTDNGDGLVLGITTSTGVAFQFDDFQVGLMLGADRAAGELGKDWIYNDKIWYSFSIGYSFIGKKDKTEED
jgi:hypothetical protein